MNLKKAMDDITAARLLLSPASNPTNDEGLFDLAAYHIQQGIEKALKHLLHDHYGMDDTTRKFRTHDLAALIFLVEGYGFQVSNGLKRRASDISDWETNSRYGGNLLIEKREMEEAITLFYELISQIKDLKVNNN